MSEILWAFLIGLSWVVGVIGGIALAMRWIPKNVQRMNDHVDTVEARLALYVENSGRIADALEAMNASKGKP